MTGPELATLSTVAWAVLTAALLVVLGTWSAGDSWSILPGLVRGVRNWAAERQSGLEPFRVSPRAAEPIAPLPSDRLAELPVHPAEPDEVELGVAVIEDLGGRRLD
jgi:hypothetical protein